MRLSRRSLLAALAAAALSACERVPTITPADVAADPVPLEVRGLEARFGEIAGEVPGFGGYFYDADGALAAYLADPAGEPALRAILARVQAERRPSDRERRTAEIRVLPGRYSFAQLATWRDRLASLLPLPGVVFVDVDEVVNRVRIGVVRDEARPTVRDAAFRLGIPPEALVISAERSLQRLTGPADAAGVPGGRRVAFESARSTVVQCSLGFNVLDPDGGYVTASHCSRVQGQVDGTVHHQPGDAQALGTEIADPPLFQRGACPETRRCRYSDAARFRLAPGRVAEPTLARAAEAEGTMRVSGERAYPVAGEVVDKVGAETGWTSGVVAATCVNVNVDGTDVTLLCQDVVDAPARGGDSGAPVYAARGGEADLAGILWGGTGARFYFSSMATLRAELGPLTTR